MGLEIFCLLALAGAIETVRPPAEELRVSCAEGCVRSLDGNRFYANAGMAVRLAGEIPAGGKGEWFDGNGNALGRGNNIIFAANAARELVFAGDGQQKTVYLSIIEDGNCLPDFDSEILVVGENKGQESFVLGEVFTVKVDIGRDGCNDYYFRWGTDNDYDVLGIRDYGSSETDIYVKSLPRDGKNPTLTAALWNNAGDRKEKHLKLRIGETSLPEIELAVEVRDGDKIFVSRAGSTTPNEDSEIEKTHVELYYYGATGRERISRQDYDAQDLLLAASRGEGLYQVRAYVVDSHGIKSQTVERSVRVGSVESRAPNVYVANRTIYCAAGGSCDIDAWGTYYHDKGSLVRYFDEQGREFTKCRDFFECRTQYSKPGTYRIEVRAYRFGKDQSYNRDWVALVVE